MVLSSRRIENGFTLIEIVVVVAIIALAALIVTPNLVNVTPKYKLRSAATKLGSKIEFIMDQAVSTGRTYFLYYDLDQNSYRIYLPPYVNEEGEEVEGEFLTPEVLPEQVHLRRVLLPGGEGATSGRIFIEFNPVRTEGAHIATVQFEEGNALSVKANSFSGIVSYFEGETDFLKYEEAEE